MRPYGTRFGQIRRGNRCRGTLARGGDPKRSQGHAKAYSGHTFRWSSAPETVLHWGIFETYYFKYFLIRSTFLFNSAGRPIPASLSG
jgi:hypothetical protein